MSTAPTNTIDQSVINSLTNTKPLEPTKPTGGEVKTAPAAPDPAAPVTYTVNGQSVTKPLAEWLADASKAQGADAALQSVATEKKVAEAVKVLNQPEATIPQQLAAHRTILKYQGMDDATIEAALAELSKAAQPNVDPKLAELEAKLAGVEAKNDLVVGQQKEYIQNQLDSNIKTFINSDPQFSAYLKGENVPPARAARMQTLVEDMALKYMTGLKASGQKFQLSWISESLPKIKESALKAIQSEIGNPAPIGRLSETIAGVSISSLPSEAPKAPNPGANEQKMSEYIKNSFLHGLASSMAQTAQV